MTDRATHRLILTIVVLAAIVAVAAIMLIVRLMTSEPVSAPLGDMQVRSSALQLGAPRASRVMTLADGSVAYQLAAIYTTTLGDVTYIATRDDRAQDEYARALPYHPGFHYIRVEPTIEISPTGQWDVIWATLSKSVTETVVWRADVTQTRTITYESIPPGTVITLTLADVPDGEPTITQSLIITHEYVSPLVAGGISVTKYISEDGVIVPGTISATLFMVFEAPNNMTGLVLDYQGLTGTFTIANEQDSRFYSAPAFVGDYDFAQFQVSADAVLTTTMIGWRPQFAPAVNGNCSAATGWADGAEAQPVYVNPDRGGYLWSPLYPWSASGKDEALGLQVRVRNECTRVAFEGPVGVTFTPTIYLRAFNP